MSDEEWELAKDRELDEMTDEQLIYLHAAIKVTLDERGWYEGIDDRWHQLKEDRDE